MFQITDVIKHLLIINLIVFFGVMITEEMGSISAWMLYFHYPQSAYFEPYQIVTHMFMHGSVPHLFFNMLALVMLGPYVEHYLGSKRFLILYLISGFGALGLHLLIWHFELSALLSADPAQYAMLMAEPEAGVVGASGAVYGVLAAFAALFPNTRLMLLFPPIPIKAKYLVAALVAFDLISGLSGSGTGIAHFAHVGGALFGFLTLLFWRKRRFN
jgi:membrane associated rhomboid family serine protease